MRIISVAALLAFILAGCYDDDKETLYPTVVCDTTTVTYLVTVKPIITQYCAYSGCHSGAAPASGLGMDTYDGLQAIALNGKLTGVVNHATGFSPMPKNSSKLSACNISKITKWINNGSLNN